MPAVAPEPLVWQPSLLAAAPMRWAGEPERHQLDAGTWVDHRAEWLQGSDALFTDLVRALPWRTGDRPMYDRMVAVPRLSAFVSIGDDRLPPIIGDMAAELSARYGRELDRVGCNLYRDGRDSVAWHGDRVAKVELTPMVAIVSLGARRPFLLRPGAGGRSIRFVLGGGDLLVMGGRCQHDWQHCVPKVAHAGPRLSVTFRHGPEPADTWRFAGR